MALDLAATYPGQMAVDGAYPQGKARNRSTPGDSDGTPWEEQIVNDLLGLEQSLIDAAGITPSGVPDEVGASDYFDALTTLFRGTRLVQPLAPLLGSANATEVPTDWTFLVSALAWVQQTNTAYMIVPLPNLPPRCTLVALRVMGGGDIGAGGPTGTLPTTPLELLLQYVDGAGVVQQPAGTLTGQPANVGAFNVVHEYIWTLTTPLAIDMATEQFAMYARIDAPQDGTFDSNAFGLLRLQCVITD